MAFQPGSSELWLAGPRADSGRFVEADSGKEWSFGGDPVSVQALAWSEGGSGSVTSVTRTRNVTTWSSSASAPRRVAAPPTSPTTSSTRTGRATPRP
ncbi:hypothetical protein G7085_07185 [Tessaracoccus sp. HDW20]|uniref:hypothetical protein n=1 Tax=Tessaracoccus coleopterorum TaxID=2714950 RepID=UPI0018D30C71|nr:hypothetical protein [Tessaracoccus coleopterorum]NHB84460.1 hypothetical protein [Tessaracoccus coleopterorum]